MTTEYYKIAFPAFKELTDESKVTFENWAEHCLRVLRPHADLEGILTGIIKRPITPAGEAGKGKAADSASDPGIEWDRKDATIFAILSASLLENQTGSSCLREVKTSHEAWTKLGTTYNPATIDCLYNTLHQWLTTGNSDLSTVVDVGIKLKSLKVHVASIFKALTSKTDTKDAALEYLSDLLVGI